MDNGERSAGIYARVSPDQQAVDMQLAELRDFVKRSGWRIHREYIDLGYTGANTSRLHSAIGYITPKDKLEGREKAIFAQRDRKLQEAREERRARRQRQRQIVKEH